MQAIGRHLKTSGCLAEAADMYRQCLEFYSDNHDVLYEYAEILLQLEHAEEAAEFFRRALAQSYGDPATVIMLAMALQRNQKSLEALHYYRYAQRLTPHLGAVHLMAGVTATDCGFRDEGRRAFLRALEVAPEYLAARLCSCMMHLDMPDSYVDLERKRGAYTAALGDLVAHTQLDSEDGIRSGVEAAGLITPFFLAYQGRKDLNLQKVYGEWLTRVMKAAYPDYQSAVYYPKSGEKIRVGFVSAHFRDHSVWKILTRGWMKHLDRNRFEIFGYYVDTKHDGATDEAISYADHFERKRDVASMARTILLQKPHVLIYPELMMDPYALMLAALRLAPVQCVAWGHPVTSGLPNMDYFISSDLMEPPHGADHYSETLVRLPNLSVCYEPLPLPADSFGKPIPGVDCGDVSFLCCQNLMKYLPQFDDVFPVIALQVPRAKFVFLKFLAEHQTHFLDRLNAAFNRYALSVEKHVIFLPPLDAFSYAALNAGVDIYLDSIGWSGGNTTLESLPFNKPIVTFPGEFMRSRHTAAILRMMGVEDTIASSVDEYVAIAVRLAKDKAMYDEVSAKIAANKHRIYGDRESVFALEDFLERSCSMAESVRWDTSQ
ncbi:MAG: tetratricopeptide repeat protein [Geobacteraceae bacterium]|nr:tetratricopeptide repeat protein [Geobacteraceae bacterium]